MSDDSRALEWGALEHKREAAPLTQFECAEPWPKSPGGRRLPEHPRSWEWDAQRHVRNLQHLMRPGDRVLVGVDKSKGTDVTAAVLHVRFRVEAESRLVAILEVGAVAMSHRSPDPPYLGDEIMAVAEAEARAAMERHSCTSLILAGFIHAKNNASMYMADRNRWEPLGAPRDDGYVPWGRRLV